MSKPIFVTSKRKLEDEDDLSFPINEVAHMILMEAYKDNFVVPNVVIELLKDYNPFSYKTGLSKKQVSKYLLLLLDETPDLADYLISCLPDASQLLPLHLLEKIPKLENDEQKVTKLKEIQHVSTQTETRVVESSKHESVRGTTITNSILTTESSHSPADLLTPLQLNDQIAAAWDTNSNIDNLELDGSIIGVAGSPQDSKNKLSATTYSFMKSNDKWNNKNGYLHLPALTSLLDVCDKNDADHYTEPSENPIDLSSKTLPLPEICSILPSDFFVTENLFVSKQTPYSQIQTGISSLQSFQGDHRNDPYILDIPEPFQQMHGVFPQAKSCDQSSYQSEILDSDTTPKCMQPFQVPLITPKPIYRSPASVSSVSVSSRSQLPPLVYNGQNQTDIINPPLSRFQSLPCLLPKVTQPSSSYMNPVGGYLRSSLSR